MGRFYLCNNPFVRLKEGIEAQMYHDGSPRYFSYIRTVKVSSAYPMALDVGPNFGFISLSPDDQMKLYFIVISDNINRAPINKLKKNMQDQAQFYVDQLNHRDYLGQEKQSKWMLFKDYSILTPGLQVIEFKTQKTFMVSHPTGLTSYTKEDDLFDFLIDVLGYSQEQLSQGGCNVVKIKKEFLAQAL